jgi:RNA polymerase sigma-70 factor, ECF subfamily
MIDFHTVYEAHARDLHRFALYLSGDPAMADDLVAESFVRLWTTRGEIRTETVKGYLLAIIRNLYLTSRRRSARLSQLDDETTPVADRAERIDTRLIQREELARVRRTLSTLSEIDRSALLLRAFEGLSYEDIARVLDITLAAAKVKVHRARLRLAADPHFEEKLT